MNVFIDNKLVAAVALTLVLLMVALPVAFVSTDRDTLAEVMPATEAPSYAQEAPEPAITEEVIWLARVIYSETKQPKEQELVAWVVRNRMETQYRGASTYQQVVLAPWQFSAFNSNAPKRVHYTSLTSESQEPGWQTAIAIAYDVLNAPADMRPFAQDTRHFYSERSMVGRSHPAWATGQRPVSLDREVDPRRFRFFRGIA